jgi:hypothetical protein
MRCLFRAELKEGARGFSFAPRDALFLSGEYLFSAKRAAFISSVKPPALEARSIPATAGIGLTMSRRLESRFGLVNHPITILGRCPG